MPALQGDAECDGDVDLQDVLVILDESAGLAGSCGQPASAVQTAERDDVNCDGLVNTLDALDDLLSLAELPELTLPTNCPLVGQPL